MTLQKIKEAWKAVIAALPVVIFGLTAIVSAMNDSGISVPPWLATLVAFVTAIGVYFKANAFSPSDETSTPGPRTSDHLHHPHAEHRTIADPDTTAGKRPKDPGDYPTI